MKRLLAMLALVAGLAVAGFYGYQHFLTESEHDHELAYVPADTPFFLGSLEPREWSDWLQRLPKQGLSESQEVMAELQELFGEAGAAGGLFLGLYGLYSELIQDPVTLPQRLGIVTDQIATVYGIGLVPVVRQPLQDAAAFRSALDEAELRGGVSHQLSEFQGEAVRRYNFGDDFPYDLMVLVRDEVAIFTLDTGFDDGAVLALALGQEQPASSLAEAGLVEEVLKRHQLEPAALGFINHQRLIAGLTGADESYLTQMLSVLDGETGGVLEPLRTPSCQRDLQALAKLWPMTVMGYTRYEPAAGVVSPKFVFAAESERQMQELIRLQGHAPDYDQGQEAPLLAAALGLDVDELVPVALRVWQALTRADYQCDFLLAWQQELRQLNPSLLGLATAVVSGMRGVGAAVYDVQLTDQVEPESLRAVLTLTADDPVELLERLQLLSPALADLSLEEGGPAVRLPPLFESMPPLMVAIRGPHIVVYAGAGLDDVLQSLARESLRSDSLWRMRIDYGRLIPLLLQGVKHSAASEALLPEDALILQEQLDQLADFDMTVELDVELAPEGVVLHGTVKLD